MPIQEDNLKELIGFFISSSALVKFRALVRVNIRLFFIFRSSSWSRDDFLLRADTNRLHSARLATSNSTISSEVSLAMSVFPIWPIFLKA